MSPRTEVRPTLYSEWYELEARAEAAEAKVRLLETWLEEKSSYIIEQDDELIAAEAKLKVLQEAAADAILRIGIGRYGRASEILEAALAQSKE